MVCDCFRSNVAWVRILVIRRSDGSPVAIVIVVALWRINYYSGARFAKTGPSWERIVCAVKKSTIFFGQVLIFQMCGLFWGHRLRTRRGNDARPHRSRELRLSRSRLIAFFLAPLIDLGLFDLVIDLCLAGSRHVRQATLLTDHHVA